MPGKSSKRKQHELPSERKVEKRSKMHDEEASAIEKDLKSRRQLNFGEDESRNYWILKSEPNKRLVNNVDVSYSLTALMSEPGQQTCWDGVRNMEARNNLRKMKIGDIAFFYHSNCRDPGIVGIVQIVKEAYPDPSQFSIAEPYFDKKSTAEEPRWDMVDVKFVRRMRRDISLAELRKYYREHSQSDGPLKDLVVVERHRLSVLPLTKSQYEFILQLEAKNEGTE